nr:golgin subfamily A member 4-like isoform X1 [Rhipicephalus microplus]
MEIDDPDVDDVSLTGSSCLEVGDDFSTHRMETVGSPRFQIPAHLRSLQEYEEHIISLRRDNLHLRLRLYFLARQGHSKPIEDDPDVNLQYTDMRKMIDAEIQKILDTLKERDTHFGTCRAKIEELERLLENAYQEKSEIKRELSEWKQEKGIQEIQKKALGEKQIIQSTTKMQEELVSAHTEKWENASNNKNVSWSFMRPRVQAFLEQMESALATGDIKQACKVEADFKQQLSTLLSAQGIEGQSSTSVQDSSSSLFEADPCNEDTAEVLKIPLSSGLASPGFVLPSSVTVGRGEISSSESYCGNERLIDSLSDEVMRLKALLQASQARQQQLEGEIKSSSQFHIAVCKQKDKLLESAKTEIQELTRQAEEALEIRSRQVGLKSECNCLHSATRQKTTFVEELLSDRSNTIEETEKTIEDLLSSLRQKDDSLKQNDELIKNLQAKLKLLENATATHGTCVVLHQNLPDSKCMARESLIASDSVEMTPQRCGRTSFFGSPASLDSSDTGTVLYLSQCTSEVKKLCDAICKLAQEVLPELATFDFPRTGTVPELIEILSTAQDKGLRFCMPSQSNHEGHMQDRPDVSQIALPARLSEKLRELALMLGVKCSDVPFCLRDILGVLDALIEKTMKESIYNAKDSTVFHVDPSSPDQERASHSTTTNMPPRQFSNESDHTEAADYQKELLGEIDSALECVEQLHSDVDALSLTPTSSMLKKADDSTDELVFAVDSTGQLVQVVLESGEQNEHIAKEMSVQTEADDDVESLRGELRNAKAQVKFLQRSLKDSFSVKITESPTGPNAQPLIEIDQNLPHHGSLTSPRKSALSANRRWRKQLTNQKMSEFGLSENVFELQEEIFFLVLRIEDLERQLKESSEVMVSKYKDKQSSEQPILTDACLLEKNAALEQQLQHMQEMSVVLLCRLEELAQFLGQLLAYDETRSLGSMTLSPSMVAKIRQFVADSREISSSFHSMSQGFLGSDTSSILNDHLSKRGSLGKNMPSFLSLSEKNESTTTPVNKPPRGKLDIKMIPPSPGDYAFMEDELKILRDRVAQQQKEISALTRRLEEECPERASSAVGGRCPSRRHPGTPASLCEGEDTDASWRYQDQVVLVQASDSDDILLLLNERGLPENVYLRSTWQKQALNAPESPSIPAVASVVAAEEADADADYSSSSPSLLRWKDSRNSALENNVPQEPLVPIGRFQCWSSDSDIWSEPDRSVSEQRMGGVCRKGWSKQPRRSPKEARKALVGGRQEPGSDNGLKKAKDTLPDLSRGKRLSCPAADGGRSKRATLTSFIKTRELEKLLRRIQQCGSRLEDTLSVHKESCQKLLGFTSGESSKDASASPQVKLTDLTESHANSMRKLQFRLEEMFINNQVLQELLTEYLASEKVVSVEASTPSRVGADSRVSATEQLDQCKKELECKERREEILKRAIVREQNSKLQLEKELADCQKELQSLHEAHSIIEGDHEAIVQRNVDSFPEQHQNNLSPEGIEGTTTLQYTKCRSEETNVCDDSYALMSRVHQQAKEIARLGKEETLLQDKIVNLLEEKAQLLQKLDTTQHAHEVLSESTSKKISELVTKLGLLSTQNKKQQEEIRGLRDKCDCLSREKVTLECDINATFSKLEGLRVENKDLRDTLLALRKQESQLREMLDKVTNELQAAKKISDEYSQSDEILRMEKDQLAAKIADLSLCLNGLQCEKQSLYEEKQRLILQVSAGEDEVERIASKLQNCEEECNTLKTQKIELETYLRATNEKFKESEHSADQLREELSVTKLKLDNMSSRYNHLEKELGTSKDLHKQMQWKNDELQRTLEAVGREAQQSKSFARMTADKRHVIAMTELEDKKKSLQSAVSELKLKLERAVHENRRLKFELRAREPHQVNSSGNTSTSDASLQFSTAPKSSSPPQLSPHQSAPESSRQPVIPLRASRHTCAHSRSQHTSPDLGIDSDAMPEHEFYSAAGDSIVALTEHWQHCMGANWSISTAHSAPEVFGANCLLCQDGTDNASSWKQKAHATCPSGNLLELSDSHSPSKSGLPAFSCNISSPGVRMSAIVQLSDHEQLKKRVDESICLIRRVESVVEQALEALADFASDCTEPPECKGLLEDAAKGCLAIKGCLTDSFKLICSFTIVPAPEPRDETSLEKLRLELAKLQEAYTKQTGDLQRAREEILAFKEKKEGMEKAITRQLNKTKMVLKQTRGNLTSMRSRDSKPERDPKAERNAKPENPRAEKK